MCVYVYILMSLFFFFFSLLSCSFSSGSRLPVTESVFFDACLIV